MHKINLLSELLLMKPLLDTRNDSFSLQNIRACVHVKCIAHCTKCVPIMQTLSLTFIYFADIMLNVLAIMMASCLIHLSPLDISTIMLENLAQAMASHYTITTL